MCWLSKELGISYRSKRMVLASHLSPRLLSPGLLDPKQLDSASLVGDSCALVTGAPVPIPAEFNVLGSVGFLPSPMKTSTGYQTPECECPPPTLLPRSSHTPPTLLPPSSHAPPMLLPPRSRLSLLSVGASCTFACPPLPFCAPQLAFMGAFVIPHLYVSFKSWSGIEHRKNGSNLSHLHVCFLKAF